MSHHSPAHKPTKTFLFYAANLIVRAALLAAAVLACIFAPEQLSITESFGFAHGISLIDVIFVLVVLDGLTKLLPNARIAIGSRKQFGRYHVPTPKLLLSDPEQLRGALRRLFTTQRAFIESRLVALHTRLSETRAGLREVLQALLSNGSVLAKLPIAADRLKAKNPVRARIRADRHREIAPVIVFWVLFNGAVALVLGLFGILNEPALIIWMLFFFLFDMICVVLWCPLQLLFMRNRCCTTCQIFNWDAIMTVTPLFFMIPWLSTAPFVWPLIALSLVVLVRWELAFLRHPERFDERTNAALSCVNCPDQLCFIREPLTERLRTSKSEDLAAAKAEIESLVTTLTAQQSNPEGKLRA